MASTMEPKIASTPPMVRLGHSPMKPRKKAIWEWKIVAPRDPGFLRQADPAPHDGQSRHVRGGSRQRDHHRAAGARRRTHSCFNLQITLWLWFTVLFANFAEAMAEGRGKAQADTLRKARSETIANRDARGRRRSRRSPARSCARATWSSSRPANSSPPTARSSKASLRWTSRRSPASPRP